MHYQGKNTSGLSKARPKKKTKGKKKTPDGNPVYNKKFVCGKRSYEKHAKELKPFE